MGCWSSCFVELFCMTYGGLWLNFIRGSFIIGHVCIPVSIAFWIPHNHRGELNVRSLHRFSSSANGRGSDMKRQAVAVHWFEIYTELSNSQDE